MTPASPTPLSPGEIPAFALTQRINVPYEYSVHFTQRVFDPRNPLFAEIVTSDNGPSPRRILLYLDSGVCAASPALRTDIEAYIHAHADRLELVASPRVLAGGEQVKNGWRRVQDVMTDIGDHKLCRQSYVVAVGGGAVLDMVGFAASLVHRGIRLVRIPTTVLAQNDAGIGVKTGMNAHRQKNFVGTFAPPYAVINDFEFLDLLPQKEWVAGIAEAFKIALIRDAEFFDFLCKSARSLRRRDAAAMHHLVKHCARLHLDHIREGGDPFESGSVRPLDFGHWSAHKLELMSDYTVGHGQAVSIGIALDTLVAARHHLLQPADVDRIFIALQQSGLPTWHYLLDQKDKAGLPAILAGLEEFREHLGGRLSITLPDGLGHRIEVDEMDIEMIAQCIDELRSRGTSPDDQAALDLVDFDGSLS